MLNDFLTNWEAVYGSAPSETSLALRFKGVIKRAYEQTGQRVAILVDEYDKPMLQAIGNEELQRVYRSILKPFYGVLKTMDGCIKRFADGGYQVWQGQCVQRFEQLGRYLHVE